jgi:hypothetical protein
MKSLIIGWLIFAAAFMADARAVKPWAYQELYDQADVVVVARPTGTQDTPQHWILPEIRPHIHVIGLSTDFEVSLVMKGDKDLKKLTLHHYRLDNQNEIIPNGPNLASFDPTKRDHFLLFLHREADGRYAPVSGQNDPATVSIIKLEGTAR